MKPGNDKADGEATSLTSPPTSDLTQSTRQEVQGNGTSPGR